MMGKLYSSGNARDEPAFQRVSWPLMGNSSTATSASFNRITGSTETSTVTDAGSFLRGSLSPTELYSPSFTGSTQPSLQPQWSVVSDQMVMNYLSDIMNQEQHMGKQLPSMGSDSNAVLSPDNSQAALKALLNAGVQQHIVPQSEEVGGAGGEQHGSLLVTSGTNPSQAAALLSFALSMNHAKYFSLVAHGASGYQAAVNLLQVVIASNQRGSISGSMLHGGPEAVLIPFLAAEDSGNFGVIVVRLPLLSHFYQAKSLTLNVDEGNPFSLGSKIHVALMSSNVGVVDVKFEGGAASTALQALAVARAHLSGNEQELVMAAIPVASVGCIPWPSFHVRVATSSQALSSLLQAQLAEVLRAHEKGSRAGNHGTTNANNCTNSNRNSNRNSMCGAPNQDIDQDPNRLHSAEDLNRASAMVQAAASMVAQQQMHQQAAAYAAAFATAATFVTGGSAYPTPGMPPVAPAPAPALTPIFDRASIQSDTSGGDSPTNSHSGMLSGCFLPMLQPPPPKVSRNRRADYVIVTEDTQVKNAAGALAKVLGRISHIGLGCPLYTEKRGDSFTAVVGAGVKAIAVSRGYVCNEKTGHEVGFQPYFRPVERQTAPQGLEQYMLEKRMMENLCLVPGMLLLLRNVDNQMTSAAAADADSANREHLEIAFDVFKVPITRELTDTGHSPVKVTAHSRVPVVSNIIIRLLDEAGQVELVSAGGRAMHVAMHAVIHARAQLSVLGVDILLLPRFHTVDTMSSHGYESVFIRFHIIRALPVPLPGDVAGNGCSSFIMTPAHVVF